jgi:hypothetical protein
VRFVTSLADLLQDGCLLFPGEAGFKYDDHISFLVWECRRSPQKKPQVETCGGVWR